MAAAEGSAKVILRCEAAKESKQLMLDDCDLMKFPDAVFFLLKGAQLDLVNLSHNTLKKLPLKFGPEFHTITSLNLSHNKFETIPKSLREIKDLKMLDFSSNNITAVTPGEVEGIERVKLTGNPLNDESRAALAALPNVTL